MAQLFGAFKGLSALKDMGDLAAKVDVNKWMEFLKKLDKPKTNQMLKHLNAVVDGKDVSGDKDSQADSGDEAEPEEEEAVLEEVLEETAEGVVEVGLTTITTAFLLLQNLIRFSWAFIIFTLALLALSFLFELIYPFNLTPEESAARGVEILVVVQRIWDFSAAILNAGFSVLRPLIPLWNGLVQYTFQPLVFIFLEVVAMLLPPFFDPDIFYAMSPVDPTSGKRVSLPFYGFDCRAGLSPSEQFNAITSEPANPEYAARTAMAWCGVKGWFQAGITGMHVSRKLAETHRNVNGGWLTSNHTELVRNAVGGRLLLPWEVVERVVERRLSQASAHQLRELHQMRQMQVS